MTWFDCIIFIKHWPKLFTCFADIYNHSVILIDYNYWWGNWDIEDLNKFPVSHTWLVQNWNRSEFSLKAEPQISAALLYSFVSTPFGTRMILNLDISGMLPIYICYPELINSVTYFHNS